MFSRVLMTTDGSPAALSAAEAAARASTPGGEVLLLAVVPSLDELLMRTAASTIDPRAAHDLARETLEQRRAEARAGIDEAARAVEAAGGTVGARLIKPGDPGPVIIATAEAEGCDLIAIATAGRTGWRRAILGSVAEHVVHHSERVPVLLVRRSAG